MNIIKAERQKDGTIIHETEQDGAVKKIRYQELRGGISWAGVSPVGSAPHYFCIAGVEWAPEPFEGQDRQKGILRLVSEGVSESIMDRTDFSRRLTDDAARLCCSSFYADIRETEGDQNPHVKALEEFRYANKISGITLYQAPYVENFVFGIGEINSLREKRLIDIGKGMIVHEQLSRMQAQDLIESPEIRFYAVNALRHVVGSFFKSPASSGKHYTPNRPQRPRAYIG